MERPSIRLLMDYLLAGEKPETDRILRTVISATATAMVRDRKKVLPSISGYSTFPAPAGRNKPALILYPGGGCDAPIRERRTGRVAIHARDGVERSCSVRLRRCHGVKPLHALSASVAWVRGTRHSSASRRLHCGRRISAGATSGRTAGGDVARPELVSRGTVAGAPTECGGAVLSSGLGGVYAASRQALPHVRRREMLPGTAEVFRSRERWFLRTCRARFCSTP